MACLTWPANVPTPAGRKPAAQGGPGRIGSSDRTEDCSGTITADAKAASRVTSVGARFFAWYACHRLGLRGGRPLRRRRLALKAPRVVSPDRRRPGGGRGLRLRAAMPAMAGGTGFAHRTPVPPEKYLRWLGIVEVSSPASSRNSSRQGRVPDQTEAGVDVRPSRRRCASRRRIGFGFRFGIELGHIRHGRDRRDGHFVRHAAYHDGCAILAPTTDENTLGQVMDG